MAAIKAFKKVALKDKEANKLQSNIEQVFAAVLRVPLLDGVLVKSVEMLTGQDNLVEHKLGREPIGWFIARQRASAIIWDTQDDNTFKKKSLSLRCSANVTVDVYIF